MLTFKMIKISEIWHIWGCYHKSALSTLDNSAWIRIRGQKNCDWVEVKSPEQTKHKLNGVCQHKVKKNTFSRPPDTKLFDFLKTLQKPKRPKEN